MPCRCSGVKYEKCECKLLATTCPLSPKPASGAFLLLNQDEHTFRFRKAEHKEKGAITNFIENLYDNCAAYNIRHCPLRRLNDNNSTQLAVKDFWLLICFMLANLVVFLTIFFRMTANVSCVVFEFLGFVKRMLLSKSISSDHHSTSSLTCQSRLSRIHS